MKQLVNYGIHTEKSDLRAHVSPASKCVYVFPTKSGVTAIENGKGKMTAAYTGSMKTAEGRIVPLKEIEGLKTISIPANIFLVANFIETDNTSKKGEKAVFVVKELIKLGLIPISLRASEVVDLDMQIQGTDLIVTAQCKIQVKCDWKVGITGNLFLQLAELNPFKAH